jgi:hypothetical protein
VAHGPSPGAQDENAYFATGPWKKVPRPAIRDAASNGIWKGNAAESYGSPLGHVVATQEEVNLKELVKGTKGRSCDQVTSHIWTWTHHDAPADA